MISVFTKHLQSAARAAVASWLTCTVAVSALVSALLSLISSSYTWLANICQVLNTHYGSLRPIKRHSPLLWSAGCSFLARALPTVAHTKQSANAYLYLLVAVWAFAVQVVREWHFCNISNITPDTVRDGAGLAVTVIQVLGFVHQASLAIMVGRGCWALAGLATGFREA
ncbi:hypothetical protein KVT40_009229 [Elsinoe batatas]|uniref:Uncharacterized protein n=1 Tax=Elsinoe batatas TaxID=2601811 RepID=A0A8K0KTJ8_9PEZI|nr:hypothetical protein KVT40_009229 [Elsinoe batatas]